MWLTLLFPYARFICGFLFGTIPWYIGACLLLFVQMDYREKPGLIVCMLAVSWLSITCPPC